MVDQVIDKVATWMLYALLAEHVFAGLIQMVHVCKDHPRQPEAVNLGTDMMAWILSAFTAAGILFVILVK